MSERASTEETIKRLALGKGSGNPRPVDRMALALLTAALLPLVPELRERDVELQDLHLVRAHRGMRAALEALAHLEDEEGTEIEALRDFIGQLAERGRVES